MSQEPIYVGIDMSKERVDVAARPTGTSWSVSYNSDGIDDLVAHLKDLNPAGVITESTGGLELPLAATLVEAQGVPVTRITSPQFLWR